MQFATIAAIATPPGQGGIGIVRISGPDAIALADRIFTAHSNRPLSALKGYSGALGRVADADGAIDEVVAYLYRAPKSYTGEDVVELCCHGSNYLLGRVLQACLTAGARLAEPGEFTKRAFLAGKLSLTQAEAVADLIASHSLATQRAALAARDGALFAKITAIRSQLVTLSSHLAAWVDFPEEDVEDPQIETLLAALRTQAQALREMVDGYRTVQLQKNGVPTAIVGRPNVGKSTLMNLLAGCQRSIVTDIAGTTRDVVEQEIQLGNLTLRLADTAGIRATDDPVESMGVALAHKYLQTAQLVLAVFDGNQPLQQSDYDILAQLSDRPAIAVVNKSDLDQQLDIDALRAQKLPVVTLSARSGQGAEALEQAIVEQLSLARFDPSAAQLANQRQLQAAVAALDCLDQAIAAAAGGVTWDAIAVLIDQAIDQLLALTGESASEQVIDAVFESFCVGK